MTTAREILRRCDQMLRDADEADKAANLLHPGVGLTVRIGTYELRDRDHLRIMADALKSHATQRRVAARDLEAAVEVVER